MKGRLFFTLTLLTLTACPSGEKVSFTTLESARQQVIENVNFISAEVRRTDPTIKGWDIRVRGDSTQTSECPQGDGWASVDFISNGNVVKYKCSTVSLSVGCMSEADFKTKSYASQDGVCNKEIPFPLPKIVK